MATAETCLNKEERKRRCSRSHREQPIVLIYLFLNVSPILTSVALSITITHSTHPIPSIHFNCALGNLERHASRAMDEVARSNPHEADPVHLSAWEWLAAAGSRSRSAASKQSFSGAKACAPGFPLSVLKTSLISAFCNSFLLPRLGWNCRWVWLRLIKVEGWQRLRHHGTEEIVGEGYTEVSWSRKARAVCMLVQPLPAVVPAGNYFGSNTHYEYRGRNFLYYHALLYFACILTFSK